MVENVSGISYEEMRNILLKEVGIDISEKAYKSIVASLKEEGNYKEQSLDMLERDLEFFCALTGEMKENMLYSNAYELFRGLDRIVGEELFITTGKPEKPMDRVDILDEVEEYMEEHGMEENMFKKAEAVVKTTKLEDDLINKIEVYVDQLKR
ncbi:MAG: hypothetical protein N4A47_04840 [Clostridia bacterium]|nr:hypothetical protein [Clostridia bacterium]